MQNSNLSLILIFALFKPMEMMFASSTDRVHSCDHSGMKSAFVCDRNRGYISYAQHNAMLENNDNRYYIYANGGGIICPLPYSYLWFKFIMDHPKFMDVEVVVFNKFVAPDFSFRYSMMDKCYTNSACEVGQFCGDVVNRSENDKYSALCSNNKAKCKIDNDCVGGKCEEDIDGSPYWDEDHRFCYPFPEIPARHWLKQQFAIRPSELNVKLCNSDYECSSWMDRSVICNKDLHEDPNKRMKWSGYVPDPAPKNTGKHTLYSGLCVHAKPISYTFSHIYESSKDPKYLPVGASNTNYREHLKKCEKNGDCDRGQFCGNIISLTEDDEFDTRHKFCFAVPGVVNPPNPDNKYTVLPDELDLIPCNSTIECMVGRALHAFCHRPSGLKYVANVWPTGRQLFNGLCTDGDSYVKQCKVGGEVLKNPSCGNVKMRSFAECNGGYQGDAWCDESIDRCCRDPAIGLCPDGQTRLFNEPKCRGYDEGKPESGTCTAHMGAICKLGHCCPNVTINSDGEFIRGEYSYATNLRCQPGVRPLNYPAGYCEPESGKIVIFGKLTRLKETLTRWPEDSPRPCERDSDCSEDGDTICIFNIDPHCQYSRKSCETHSDCPGEFGICMRYYEGFCHYNPLRHIPVKFAVQYEYVWILIVIVGLGVIMIIGVVLFVKWSSRRGLKLKNAQAPVSPVQSPVG